MSMDFLNRLADKQAGQDTNTNPDTDTNPNTNTNPNNQKEAISHAARASNTTPQPEREKPQLDKTSPKVEEAQLESGKGDTRRHPAGTLASNRLQRGTETQAERVLVKLAPWEVTEQEKSGLYTCRIEHLYARPMPRNEDWIDYSVSPLAHLIAGQQLPPAIMAQQKIKLRYETATPTEKDAPIAHYAQHFYTACTPKAAKVYNLMVCGELLTENNDLLGAHVATQLLVVDHSRHFRDEATKKCAPLSAREQLIASYIRQALKDAPACPTKADAYTALICLHKYINKLADTPLSTLATSLKGLQLRGWFDAVDTETLAVLVCEYKQPQAKELLEYLTNAAETQLIRLMEHYRVQEALKLQERMLGVKERAACANKARDIVLYNQLKEEYRLLAKRAKLADAYKGITIADEQAKARKKSRASRIGDMLTGIENIL